MLHILLFFLVSITLSFSLNNTDVHNVVTDVNSVTVELYAQHSVTSDSSVILKNGSQNSEFSTTTEGNLISNSTVVATGISGAPQPTEENVNSSLTIQPVTTTATTNLNVSITSPIEIV